MNMRFMRWSEALRISSLVRPRSHTTTLGNRKVRTLVGMVPSVDEQQHATSAAKLDHFLPFSKKVCKVCKAGVAGGAGGAGGLIPGGAVAGGE